MGHRKVFNKKSMLNISQLDPKWGEVSFPGCPTNQKLKFYGCLLCCIGMLLEKTPIEIMNEVPDGWLKDGNMKTDYLLAKYGYRLVRQPVKEGDPLPVKSERYIARTSLLSPRYPTHFIVVNPDGTISDPGSSSPLKTENRYKLRINEIRFLVKIGGPKLSPLSIEERLSALEAKIH